MDEESIFAAAIERESRAERAEFLDGACGGDQQLRSRLEALLGSHEEAGTFLNQPAAPVATIDQTITERPGTEIGPYKLREQLGEGGMGIVFVAEQEEPVRRKVALKIIKPGMDTKEVIARFEAERKALAMMDHPNIARVLDAGATEAGRPYFVMELVPGVPVTEYFDKHKLHTRKRLELFVQICQAVQHAHQKGIIHRDIKPSNVLITLHDGVPVPKVIDFGVAKAINQRLTEGTVYTQVSQMIGTPLYMSPEQAELSGLNVDTRTDIYSLGVLLYELLTGTTPFAKEQMSDAGYDEMRRVIREEEPPRPSDRLSTLDGKLADTVAEQRRTELQKLTQFIRGDLDWIVMKAMDKDRTRRYETASGLTADVRRYLNDEPVEACPPSSVYKLRKFVRRNKAAMTTASLVAGALLIGTVVSTWQAVRATQAEVLAQQRFTSEREARHEADEQRQRADVNLQHTLRVVDDVYTHIAVQHLSYVPQMQSMQRELLTKALKFYEEFAENNRTDPKLRRETAKAYHRVAVILALVNDLGPRDQDGNFLRVDEAAIDEAETALRQGEALFDALASGSDAQPEDLMEIGHGQHIRGILCFKAGRRKEAEDAYRKSIELFEQWIDRFPDHSDLHTCRSHLAHSYHNLASLFKSADQHQQAVQAFRDAIRIGQQAAKHHPPLPQHRYQVARSYRCLAGTLKDSERPKDAERAYRDSLFVHSELESTTVPEYRSERAYVFYRLAELLRKQDGRHDQAEQANRQAIGIQQSLVTQFPRVSEYRQRLARSHTNLAGILDSTGRYKEAATHDEHALRIREQLADEYPDIPDYRAALANTYYGLGLTLGHQPGRQDEAEEAYRKASPMLENLSSEFPDEPKYRKKIADIHSGLGGLFLENGKFDEAEEAYQRALPLYKELASNFPDVSSYRVKLAGVYGMLGNLHTEVGRYAEAEQAHLQLLAVCEELVEKDFFNPTNRINLAGTHHNLGTLYRHWGKLRRAESHYNSARDGQKKLLQVYPEMTQVRVRLFDSVLNLGRVHGKLGEFDKAMGDYLEAQKVAAKLVEDSPGVATFQANKVKAHALLAELFKGAGRQPEATEQYEQALTIRKNLTRSHPEDAGNFFLVGQLAQWLRKWPEAIEAYRQAVELDPNNISTNKAEWLNSLAWLLATCVDAQFRDPDQAVELGKKAVELAQKDGNCWNTLGTALYRTGDWNAAIEPLEKSMRLRSGGDSFDFFFLAMAHWQLGNKDEARQFYDKAVKWMTKNKSTDEDLLRFRAEVEALLGIVSEEPKSEENDSESDDNEQDSDSPDER